MLQIQRTGEAGVRRLIRLLFVPSTLIESNGGSVHSLHMQVDAIEPPFFCSLCGRVEQLLRTGTK